MTLRKKKSLEGKEWFTCRDILWYLVFCGFAMNYMLRTNLSLAIVAMVEPKAKAVAVAQCSQDLQLNSVLSNFSISASTLTNVTEHSVRNASNYVLVPLTQAEKDTPSIHEPEPDRFSWDEYEQGLALGGYYWLYWTMQIPGGLLARRYGTKFIFGWSNLSNALIGFALPFAARCHLYFFMILRVLQGLTAGVIWSAMHTMVAKWIPPNERNKFISSYMGSSVGSALTYPISAWFVGWFGWPSVFYTTSALGVLWYVAWYYLVYETPQEHPRISEAEKSYILESLGTSVNHDNSQKVPWKAILTSAPVWWVTISSWGSGWGVHTLNSEAPSYFNYIHGWNVGAAGYLSALPHVARMVFAYFFSILADWIYRTEKMSKTNLRKFANIVCSGLQAFLLLGLGYSGCHSTLAIIFMMTAMAVNGALASGPFACCIDLSPNYGNIILGISNTLTTTAGLIGPLLVGYLTENNQTIEQWRLVFIIIFLIMLLTCVFFTIFGTADLQSWNDAGIEEMGDELQKLRSNTDKVIFQEDDSSTVKDEKETHSPDNTDNFSIKMNK